MMSSIPSPHGFTDSEPFNMPSNSSNSTSISCSSAGVCANASSATKPVFFFHFPNAYSISSGIAQSLYGILIIRGRLSAAIGAFARFCQSAMSLRPVVGGSTQPYSCTHHATMSMDSGSPIMPLGLYTSVPCRTGNCFLPVKYLGPSISPYPYRMRSYLIPFQPKNSSTRVQYGQWSYTCSFRSAGGVLYPATAAMAIDVC
mmetsp:Transcript_63991/g.105654  ORF Transcript_63991/g.105654 Transcript_63991/m.105654 type:complete len:201 (-) Transcript_63991:459-1061(-)